MRAIKWVGEPDAVLDVGCNVGAFLGECGRRFPQARLAGVEVNAAAVADARKLLPGAELHVAGAESLPFPDASFPVVTCLEVVEHVPPALRPTAFREIRRVLRPGGRLVVSVPHAG